MVIFNIFQVSSNLVGGFNPSEKYESVGMMTFPIYGKIKAMFQSPPTSNYMQLSDFLIHWNWGSPIFSPCTAGHSWGASSWRLCHRSSMMRFKRASWASRRSSRAWAWAETKTWTWNHMENIWEKHGKIGGNQIYWDVMGFEKAKNEPREM